MKKKKAILFVLLVVIFISCGTKQKKIQVNKLETEEIDTLVLFKKEPNIILNFSQEEYDSLFWIKTPSDSRIAYQTKGEKQNTIHFVAAEKTVKVAARPGTLISEDKSRILKYGNKSGNYAASKGDYYFYTGDGKLIKEINNKELAICHAISKDGYLVMDDRAASSPETGSLVEMYDPDFNLRWKKTVGKGHSAFKAWVAPRGEFVVIQRYRWPYGEAKIETGFIILDQNGDSIFSYHQEGKLFYGADFLDNNNYAKIQLSHKFLVFDFKQKDTLWSSNIFTYYSPGSSIVFADKNILLCARNLASYNDTIHSGFALINLQNGNEFYNQSIKEPHHSTIFTPIIKKINDTSFVYYSKKNKYYFSLK